MEDTAAFCWQSRSYQGKIETFVRVCGDGGMETVSKDNFAVEFMENFIMAVLDKDGRYSYVSPKWEQYVGVSSADALGKLVLDIIPESKGIECLRTGKPISVHTVSHNGVPAFTAYAPRFDAQHRVNGVFIYVIANDLLGARALARQMNTLSNEIEFYRSELSRERGARYSLENIVGSSPAMRQLRKKIMLAAQSTSTVLIEGESGTGKELIAHAIHTMSPRNAEHFVRVGCAGIPEQLIESELFGYSGSSYDANDKTGKPGRFELANHGSLFLDEINHLPSTIQSKLLHVMQDRELSSGNNGQTRPIDVRIIAASNHSLEQMVRSGQFRADLFYRFNVLRILAPPLREHLEDMQELTDALIKKLNWQLGLSVEGASEEAIRMLRKYHWPGNIRELQSVLESAMNTASTPILQVADFHQLAQSISAQRYQKRQSPGDFSLQEAKQTFEAGLVQDALDYAKGNRANAARLLGISRTVLYQKMEKYNLK